MPAVRGANGQFVKGSGSGGGHSKVTDVDKGYNALVERVAQAAKKNVLTIGIHEAEGAAEKKQGEGEGEGGSPATLAEVASFHELGLGVPRRSFIADWADENRERHEAALRSVAKAVVKGTVPDIETGLSRLGSLFVGEVQKRIADGIDPPLEEPTIERKGSSKPLIDSGQLRGAVMPYLNGKLIE